MIRGLWLMVEGGFMVYGLGLRSRVKGLGLRVKGLGFGV